MHREERDQLAVYRFDSFQELAVDALVSTRAGGVSSQPYESLNLSLSVGDDKNDVLENRRRLFSTFGLSLDHSVWCRQVHEDKVTLVGERDAGRGAHGEEEIVQATDALVTDVPVLSLCVTLADCVPVVIYDPHRSIVGLAHAGWKGTVARISSHTVEVMRDQLGSDPADLIAGIGPSVGPEEYEVGPEVVGRARQAYGELSSDVLAPGANGGTLFDLWTANMLDLESAGLSRQKIEVARISTAETLADFYSHRIEGQTGRFIAAVSLARGPST